MTISNANQIISWLTGSMTAQLATVPLSCSFYVGSRFDNRNTNLPVLVFYREGWSYQGAKNTNSTRTRSLLTKNNYFMVKLWAQNEDQLYYLEDLLGTFVYLGFPGIHKMDNGTQVQGEFKNSGAHSFVRFSIESPVFDLDTTTGLIMSCSFDTTGTLPGYIYAGQEDPYIIYTSGSQ